MQVDPLRNIAEGICRHPDYERAVLYYVERKLVQRRALGFGNQAMSSLPASHVMVFLLLLYYEGAGSAGAGGATSTRLLAICEARRTCGSRALRTILALGQMAGLVRRVRSSYDKRVHVYEPTRKLIDESLHIVAQTIGALDYLVRERNFAGLPYTDRDFVPNLIKTSIRAYVDTGIPIVEYYPQMHELLVLKGGTSSAAALVRAQLAGEKPPSTYQIGQQFRISATQVRNIIECAQSHGLVTVSPQGQLIEAGELVALYKKYFARELALYVKFTLGLEDYFLAVQQ